MSGKTAGYPGNPGHQITSELQSTTKLNSEPLPAGRRVSQIPEWVPPTLKKVPIGITERASDSHPLLVVDSFEMASSIYKSKPAGRISIQGGSPPPRPRIQKKDTSISPIAGATERRGRRQSCSPNRLIERDMRVVLWGDPSSKFHDDWFGTTTVSSPIITTTPSKTDESILVDGYDARNGPKKRDLFPCRDSPRPPGCPPNARRAELDAQMYGDREGRCDSVSWKNLSPVARRHEESRLYERMILENRHTCSNSKVRAEGAGGPPLWT